jgi:hypothetical protein
LTCSPLSLASCQACRCPITCHLTGVLCCCRRAWPQLGQHADPREDRMGALHQHRVRTQGGKA